MKSGEKKWKGEKKKQLELEREKRNEGVHRVVYH